MFSITKSPKLPPGNELLTFYRMFLNPDLEDGSILAKFANSKGNPYQNCLKSKLEHLCALWSELLTQDAKLMLDVHVPRHFGVSYGTSTL